MCIIWLINAMYHVCVVYHLCVVYAAQIGDAWGPHLHLVIAGLTNTYSSYITTFEEYGVQRYEGASTIYGPHTLDAYIQVCRDSNISLVSPCVPLGQGLACAVQSSCFWKSAPHKPRQYRNNTTPISQQHHTNIRNIGIPAHGKGIGRGTGN